jgi:hypothetical protein
MTIDWQELLTTLGVQGSFVAAISWLFKQVVSTRLKADADAELARLKSELQIMSQEHQIRFAKLHERRAEIIAELFKRLQEMEWEAHCFALISPRDQEARAKARQVGFELYRFIELNRLYFPMTVCAQLENVVGKLRRVVSHVGAYWTDVEHASPDFATQQNEVMLAACTALETDIPAAMNLLAQEFRAILGVEIARSPVA